MRKSSWQRLGICIIGLLLVMLPLMALAQTEQAKGNPPPISQPLITEGVFAVNLASALGVSSTTDIVEAESILGEIGIAPRNGWIADYPMTPDVVAEVRQSVENAVKDKRLPLTSDEALKRFSATATTAGMNVRPYTGNEPQTNQPVSCENYPNPATISSTYGSEGPPVVTYYCPPPEYYYQYAWVPYPFWWSDFWFPGFFILHDFHRHVHVHDHFVLVSNHFNDVKRHRVFRIDPVDRFHGRTFAGIGVKPSGNFIPTGSTRSSHTIFNAPHSGNMPANRGGVTPTMRGAGGGMHSGGGMHGGGMHGGGMAR